MNKLKTIYCNLLLYISIITIFSCNSQINNEKYEQKSDSLNRQNKIDSDSVKSLPTQGRETVRLPAKKTITPATEEVDPHTIITETPTEYYYKYPYILSAKITPWENKKRKVMLYDLQGNITFEAEDNISFKNSQLSTRPITNFHPNGSIAEITTIHFGTLAVNPRYEDWFTSENITYFDTNNIPQWRKYTQNPNTMYEKSINYYWDKDNKKWLEQEIIKEQQVPRN